MDKTNKTKISIVIKDNYKKSKYVYMMTKNHLKILLFYLNINNDLVYFNSGDKSLNASAPA